MIPILLHGKGKAMHCPSDVVHYSKTHLASPSEAGAFLGLADYLDPKDRVNVVIFNPNLWNSVGLELGSSQLPDKLIFNLCQGMDADGRQLAGIIMHREPVEIIVTLHCEISEALEHHPEIARLVLLAEARTLREEIECRATLVRTGDGEREWRRAYSLFVIFLHGRNKENEPHFHFHAIVFPPVFVPGLGWRTHSDRDFFFRLNTDDGVRARVGEAGRQEAAKYGFTITYSKGLASLLEPNGATVIRPDGHIIEAGSVIRKRSAGILALRHLEQALGTPPLTRREVGQIRNNPGAIPYDIPGITGHDRFNRKLGALGLLDKYGQILSNEEMTLAIQRLDGIMAADQASVFDIFPVAKKQAGAIAEAIEQNRAALSAKHSGQQVLASHKLARAIWTQAYTNLLKRVKDSGPDGLSLEGIGERDGELLLRLHRYRHVILDATNGRKSFRLSEFGSQKLAEVQALIEAASMARYSTFNALPPRKKLSYFLKIEERRRPPIQQTPSAKIEVEEKHVERTKRHRR